MDIILFGTPKSWQKEMDRQGYDPIDHDVEEVVTFLENIEAAEDFDVNNNTKVTIKKDGKPKKTSSSGGGSSGNGQQYCMLHGKGNHSTDECEALKKEAKRIKSGGSSTVKTEKSGTKNKTWSKKAQESKDKAKKDLAAFVKSAVNKAVAEATKKRKSKSDDSDDELAAFDLKDFNYEDMENLTLDDKEDGEVSV